MYNWKEAPTAELLVSYGGRYWAAHGQRWESPLLWDNVSYWHKLIRCEQHLCGATQLVITLILFSSLISMVCRIYGRLRLTGRPALHHASRQTPYVWCQYRWPYVTDREHFVCILFRGKGAWLDQIFKLISRKQIWFPLGNAPAKFHRNILRTVACQRVRTFETRKSSTFEAMPPWPGGSGARIFFAYFALGQGHDSRQFSDRYLAKNLGKNFPPGGSDP